MMRKWLCQADVAVQLTPVDPVLIKSGYATLDGADMVPVCTLKGGKQVYFLPGTSLKGVLRSHVEKIARTLKEGSVCIPYYDPKNPNQVVPVPSERQSYGCGFRGKGDESSAQIYRESCAACRLFGSLRFAGRLSISDAYPLPGREPRLEHRNGVGIDRFTGGTVHGLLFDLQVLSGGEFESKIRLVNFEVWQLAVLAILLADLRDEMIRIGSGRSRGLGRIRGNVTEFRLSYIRPVSDLAGLASLSSEEERQQYGLDDWAPQPPIALPAPVPRGLRHEFDLRDRWSADLQPLVPAFERFLQWHGGPKAQVASPRERAAQRN